MSRHLAGLLASACALIAAPLSAAPSFDCAQASSSAEELICEDAALAALDVRLAERYQQTLDVIAALDAGSAEALQTTRAMQRGWIKGRDDCWKAEDLRACVEAAYLTREAELVARWMLETPLSIVSFTCEGNPANEATAFYFDTELQGIRVEYGDGIKTGYAVPAASGAKYALEFGGLLWSKGDEAQFAWTEGEEMSCVLAGS